MVLLLIEHASYIYSIVNSSFWWSHIREIAENENWRLNQAVISNEEAYDAFYTVCTNLEVDRIKEHFTIFFLSLTVYKYPKNS